MKKHNAMVMTAGVLLFSAHLLAAATYSVPGYGKLHLAIPSGWKVSTKPVNDPPAINLMIQPASGDAWNVQVSAVWMKPDDAKKLTSEIIRQRTEASAKEPFAGAVERKLELRELKGKQTSGYYYSLTDKAPGPGEYKYLIQGIVANGQLLSAFTILSHEKETAELKQILQILADGVYTQDR